MTEPAVATPTATPAPAGSTPTAATPATPAAPAAAPAADFDITKYIEPSGKFKEGYKDALVPEELRGNKFYDIFSDIQGVIKAAGHESVELGKYRAGKGVLPLTDKSTPAEIDNWRMAHGVPKDATGYQWQAPQDISTEDLSPEFTKQVFEGFNKAHFTPAQANVAMEMYAGHLREIEKAVDQEVAREISDAQSKFDGEYGDQAPVRVQLAKEFITNVAGHWDKGKYEALFGKEEKLEDGTVVRVGGINDPELTPIRIMLIDLFANVQEKFGLEDSGLIPEGGGTPTKGLAQQLEDAKDEVFKNVNLQQSLDPRDRKRYEEMVEKRDKLYKRVYPV